MSAQMAMTRDAAWFNRPNTRHPKKWHAVDESGAPLCGIPGFLDEKSIRPAVAVPMRLQCNKRGCIAAFIEAESAAAEVEETPT